MGSFRKMCWTFWDKIICAEFNVVCRIKHGNLKGFKANWQLISFRDDYFFRKDCTYPKKSLETISCKRLLKGKKIGPYVTISSWASRTLKLFSSIDLNSKHLTTYKYLPKWWKTFLNYRVRRKQIFFNGFTFTREYISRHSNINYLIRRALIFFWGCHDFKLNW